MFVLQDYFQGLVSTLHKFRESDFMCDTVLVTDDHRELKAHSIVLAAASSVFQTAFKAAADRGPGPLQVNLREYSGEVVELALQLIYTGQLAILPTSLGVLDERTKLLSVFQRLGLDSRLIEQCTKTFSSMPSSMVTPEAEPFKDSSVKTELESDLTGTSGVISSKPSNENAVSNLNNIITGTSSGVLASNPAAAKPCLKRAASKLPSKGSDTSKAIRSRQKRSVKSELKTEDNPDATVDKSNSSTTKTTTVFACELCGRKFGKKERLVLHERTHTGERPYACDTCGRRFSLVGNLRRHLPMHTEHKPFMCELCGRTFIRKAYLADHLAVHKTSQPFSCDQCEKRFNSAGQLRLHSRWSHEWRPDAPMRSTFPCDQCGKAFSSRSNLKTHIRIHTGERPFVCVCGKSYSQRVQLLQHARVHSDERPFQCVYCSRSFRFRGSLVVHIRAHTGERPHVCDQCGKSYTNKTSLRLHASKLHER